MKLRKLISNKIFFPVKIKSEKLLLIKSNYANLVNPMMSEHLVGLIGILVENMNDPEF